MTEAIQAICKAIGANGCCFLSSLKVFGRERDFYALWNECQESGILRADGFLAKPEELAFKLTGKRWKYTHVAADYHPNPGEKILNFYKFGALEHFTAVDDSGEWDPLGNSNTRLKGKLTARRLYKEVS